MTASNGEGDQEGPLGGYTPEELVTELQASVGPENPRSDLKRRLAACEALREFADEQADSAQYLAVILPSILMEEVDRLVETGSGGEMVLVRGLSLDVQRTVLAVLNDVTTPSVFDKLDAFDDPAVELAHPAVFVLAFEFTRETTRLSAALLASLTKWRPEPVVDHITSRFDFDVVCRALADLIQAARPAPMAAEQTNETVRLATRLLAVLLVQHADQLSDPEPVAEALEAVANSDLNRTQAYVAVASDALRAAHSTGTDDLQSVRSFEAFVEASRDTDGERRMEAARAVGEGVAIERLVTSHASPADAVLEYIREVDGSARVAGALAVGEYRLADADSLTDILPKLRAQASDSERLLLLQGKVRAALGILAVAEPESFPSGIQTFVDRLDSSNRPLELAAIRELGRLIETEAVGRDGVLSTLQAALWSAEDDAKELIAEGFGELVLEVPEQIPDSVRPLTDTLEATDGTIRHPLLHALAIATMVTPATATDPTTALVDFWENPETSPTNRAWAKQALGELAIVDRSLVDDAIEPFVEHVFHGSLLGKDQRAFNTRILGEIVGSDPQTVATGIDVYVDAVRSTDDENCQWYALGALRDSLQALTSVDDDVVARLVDLVQSLDRPLRIPAVAALGEAVTMVPRLVPDELQPLHAACTAADGSVRNRLAQALGEAVARNAATPAALREEYRPLISPASGPTRWIATQELGEVLAAAPAAAPASCESLLEHAQTVHRLHRLSVTAAIGEVATLSTDADEDPIPVLEAHATGTRKLQGRYRTRLLGEAVLAEAPDVPARANDIIESVGLDDHAIEPPTFESAGGILPGTGDDWQESRMILEEFTQTPGEWRRSTILRMVGATVTESLDAYVARQLRKHIYNETPYTPVEFFSGLVENDVLDAVQFLETVLAVGSGQAVGDLDIVRMRSEDGLRRYLDSSDPGRREVLDAVARALERRPDAEDAARIRRQIQTFLTEADDIPTATRLMAIDVLTASQTRAADAL
ncbi:hypothetical protein [Haloarchaeobius sp. DYHT-AS-18]|uniref:hypothetical protein n=1 Tax=Haloarchaeobius sp. DYHT-AS-18 TaxID=3446117 RepID=UPI003EBA1F6C